MPPPDSERLDALARGALDHQYTRNFDWDGFDPALRAVFAHQPEERSNVNPPPRMRPPALG